MLFYNIGKVSTPTVLKDDIGWREFEKVVEHETVNVDTALVSYR